MIEAVALDELLGTPERLPAPAEFDSVHADWRANVIAQASDRFGLRFTHGIAATLINVYFKGGFVCRAHHTHDRVSALHPPVDELLLVELAKHNVGGQATAWRKACRLRWSKCTRRSIRR